MSKERILILGGCGFMGSNLNLLLGSTSHAVFNESRRTGCDILNYETLKYKVKTIQPTVIINAAAHVGGVGYVSDYAADVCHDNTQMYLNIYRVISEVDKDILLINPLANCSYPGVSKDVLKEEEWWDGIVHESVESYGSSKKIGYVLSQCYQKQHGIKSINLLVPNAYGPFDSLDENKTHAMNGIIVRFLRAIDNGDKDFVIWGSGTPIREWVYMEDVARLIIEIVEDKEKHLPNPLNVGQQYGFSIKESVEMVQEILKSNFNFKYDLSKTEGAPKKVMCDKLFKQTFPSFTFTKPSDGIRGTINYYINKLNEEKIKI